jgi:hypothetical protein
MEHDFTASLAKSHAAEDLPFWEKCYRDFFTNYQTMVNHRQDGEHQRAGIDRSIILSNSKQILVDEKCRFRNSNGRVYQDIALEYISNDRTGSPGWVCKPLRCDYIAYAIAPLGQCYLLPVNALQRAWSQHGKFWIGQHWTAKAKNRGYTTHSVCVPVKTVMRSISTAMFTRFDPIDQ